MKTIAEKFTKSIKLKEHRNLAQDAQFVYLTTEINYLRMIQFVYENLKLSPEAFPLSLDDKFKQVYSKIMNYKTNYDIEREKKSLGKSNTQKKKMNLKPISE